MEIVNKREDWVIEKLGEFAEYGKGKKPKKQKDEPDNIFTYPYIDIQAFEKGIFSSYTDGEKCNFCTEDDFLMVWDGSRSGLVGKGVNGALGSTLMRINLPGIENDFAYYFLKSKYQQINTRAKGTGTPHVDPGLLWQYSFPIAPLPEQRAIVAKIEQLFSGLDNGIANLEKAQEQLKVYRQTVLSQTSKVNKFESLRNLVDDLGQGWSPKCHNEPSLNDEEWAVIKTTAIQAGKFNEEENKRLPDDLEPRVKHELKAGDILITRAGPRVRVGICCLIKEVRQKLINCDKAYRIKLKKDIILPEFFELVMNSPEYTLKIEELKTGINDSGVNLTQKRFLDLEIPLPTIDEQSKIIQDTESRLSVCDKVEETIQESLEKAKALRQSILKQAFEGKLLTDQELKACRQEPDWEPAEKLLERIKAEKAESDKAKKKREEREPATS